MWPIQTGYKLLQIEAGTRVRLILRGLSQASNPLEMRSMDRGKTGMPPGG